MENKAAAPFPRPSAARTRSIAALKPSLAVMCTRGMEAVPMAGKYKALYDVTKTQVARKLLPGLARSEKRAKDVLTAMPKLQKYEAEVTKETKNH